MVHDNYVFIVFFIGEPEDNYSGEDMRIHPWLSVRTQLSMNK